MNSSASRSRSTTSRCRRGGIVAPVLLGALILCCLPALAGDSGSGYEQDYDYAGQGEDWYGRRALPRPERDFPPIFLDQILSGEDFCLGYEKFFDHLLLLGPPLFRTNDTEFDFLFRFSEADPNYPCIKGGPVQGGGGMPNCNDGNPCTNDSYNSSTQRCQHTNRANGTSCSNGLFCDGAETCLNGSCVTGSWPCDDGDSCTTDSCDETLNQCSHVPPPPPDEVTGLLLTPISPGSGVALDWDVAAGSDVYNLYRSETRDLGGLTCFQPGLAVNGTVDDGLLPSPGGVLIYLPAGANCGGDGSLGSGNPPATRDPVLSCP